jgi:hypothetical protein
MVLGGFGCSITNYGERLGSRWRRVANLRARHSHETKNRSREQTRRPNQVTSFLRVPLDPNLNIVFQTISMDDEYYDSIDMYDTHGNSYYEQAFHPNRSISSPKQLDDFFYEASDDISEYMRAKI